MNTNEACTPELASRIITTVERRLQLARGAIVRQDRDPVVCRARFMACYTLTLAGYCPAQIGRAIHRDHSSVLHNIKRGQALLTEAERVLAYDIADLPDPRSAPVALRCFLIEKLHPLPLVDRQAVYAYATCTLLAIERHPGPICLHGLWLVLARPGVRAVLEHALRRIEQSEHAGRIDLHAARLRRA